MSRKEKRKIILAVDDAPEVLTSINEILGADYDLRLVKSAAAAMTLLRSEKVDLILLDIDMPVLSGFDFQDFLKHKPDAKRIPVLFVSSASNLDTIQKAKQSGAAGYITKPFTAEIIRTSIVEIFSRRRDNGA
jgi:putative two-component system response regulator